MLTLRERVMEAEDRATAGAAFGRRCGRWRRSFEQAGVPYAVVEALALQQHGLIGRSTNDVDILVQSEEDLGAIQTRLMGRGYSQESPTSRHLRDDITRVRVEFLIAGEYPGGGQPKPVAFPQPRAVAERSDDGSSFVNLRTLIELKLASAKSAPHRLKDRADVLELIRARGLTADYAGQLDPYAREEFAELAKLPPADVDEA